MTAPEGRDRPESDEPVIPLPPIPRGTFANVRRVAKRMRGAPERRALVYLATTLVAVVVSNIFAQIWLNDWNGLFYDALERRDWPGFMHQASRFLLIAGTLLALVVAQTWTTEMIKIHLRSWLTRTLLDEWLEPKRAWLLGFVGEAGANPDQRIHEDSRHLAELTADLGASLLQATLLLVSFIGVLWGLSEQVKFEVNGHLIGIPGYMVWCALAFSIAGSALTWWVGRPMIDDNAARYAREAELRFALVRVGESAEGITLYGGEVDERHTTGTLFDAVLVSMRRLADDLARLTWVTSGYGWLALVAPVMVAAPGYFSGAMSLGGLMMVVNSFNQVQSSLRWFVDNFSRIADWRATLKRIEALNEALISLDQPTGGVDRFEVVEDDSDGVRFEDFELTLPTGRTGFEVPTVEIAHGERVQIVGEMSAGKSTLFLAISGLWTRGQGIIRRPRRERMMFLPERPYFPLGSLASALAYPDAPERFGEAQMVDALCSVGLGRLAGDLAAVERWDRVLAADEQQMLAFARLALHKPEWVVLDDALNVLGAAARRRVFAVLEAAAPSVISLTRSPEVDDFFHRSLTLVRRGRVDRRRRFVDPDDALHPSLR